MRTKRCAGSATLLVLVGTVGGVWACGEVVPEPPILHERDADARDEGSPFDGEPFDGVFPSIDGGFDDGEPFDSELSDAEASQDTEPPWEGGTAVTLHSGTDDLGMLAVDEDDVYWSDSGGAVRECPISGCPDPTSATILSNGYNTGDALGVGASMAYFTGSGSSIDSCARDGCNLAPSTYWVEPGPALTLDAGGLGIPPPPPARHFTSILSDPSNVYFTDQS
jgi:hypothetical protein